MAPNFIIASVGLLILYSGWKGASLKNTLDGGEADQGGPNLSSGATTQGGVGVPGAEGAAGTGAAGIPSHPLGSMTEAEAAAHSPFGIAPSPQVAGRLPGKAAQELMTAESVVRKDFPNWPPRAVRIRAQLLLKAKREGK